MCVYIFFFYNHFTVVQKKKKTSSFALVVTKQIADLMGCMICTTNDMHGVTWLSIQDDNARVAVVPVTDVMVGDSARLHAMTGTGWVLVSKVIVTRIAGPQIMWEAQPSHYSEISTAMVPDLTHPLFIVSTLQRVIEGEYIPEAIECPPVIISLMTVRLPQDWMGSKEGRVWYTPCDRVYFHVVANDFFNGPMIAQHMGMDVVLSFIEVKLFRQSSTAKFYPSELCCSISTTICSSIVATEFLPPSLLSVLCLGEAATNNYVHSSTAHLKFVSQSSASVSPSPKMQKPSRSPSQSAGNKKETKTPSELKGPIKKHQVVLPDIVVADTSPVKKKKTQLPEDTVNDFAPPTVSPQIKPNSSLALRAIKRSASPGDKVTVITHLQQVPEDTLEDFAPPTVAPELKPVNSPARRAIKRSASPEEKVTIIKTPWGVTPLSLKPGTRVLFRDGKDEVEGVIIGGGAVNATLQYGDPILPKRVNWANIKVIP